MAIRPIQIVTGDTRVWRFTLRDDTGAALNLTGATVTLSMRVRGATSNKIAGASMTITGATTGTVEYAPVAADVNTVGSFDIEIKVSDSASKVQHNFELIPIEMRLALNA